MTSSEILPVNFTISDQAKRGIEQLRKDYDAACPQDRAAVLAVAWGYYSADTGCRFENVVVSFYPQSMLAGVAHGIQEVSGVKLVFFTTEELHGKFAGKVLDFTAARDFFLRAP
jgi:hypothetical protein